MITYKALDKSIQNSLLDLIRKGSNLNALLNRNIYQLYQNAQRQRWMTENASEGSPWVKLNPDYERVKRRIYANEEHGGRKILIASGRLYKSVIGPSPDHRKIVGNNKLIIKTVVDYAKYVDQARTFTTFGQPTIDKIKKTISEYLMKRGAR